MAAAVAVGVAVVASGVLPGGGSYLVDATPGTPGAPAAPGTGGGPGADGSADQETRPPNGTRPEPTEGRNGPGRTPAEEGEGASARPGGPPAGREGENPSPAPTPRASGTASTAPRSGDGRPSAPGPAAEPETRRAEDAAEETRRAAEARVRVLVNRERRRAGCSPVALDPRLTELARAFSADMAERGFFTHTDPDGATPWDRAARLGIEELGGENIARGQTTAEAVMEAWMAAPEHRANILNCSYRTLGVGAHFADGGPWWTQDFGY
ncbi:CAP domain-containing protein [Streptomyces zingiberis]|uniref:CAP domain-containing protein n=1 Tax=Streptomyces zingiberis TaxID=2053010 RepID=A0ABX1C0X0_9ACTN|nr:CAP domain-containing protein [Streptomyces zingiberis]NJQ02315.1 CAP domain-containing protein [Streptomyces zingiberis]